MNLAQPANPQRIFSRKPNKNNTNLCSCRETQYFSLYLTRQEGKQRIDDQPGREVPSFLAWFPFLSSWYGALAFIRNLPIESSSFSGDTLSEYLFYDIAGGFEEVDSCGEVKGIRKAGQAESKDKEIQESEKTFFPCSKDITQHKGRWMQKNINKSTNRSELIQYSPFLYFLLRCFI